MFKRDYKIIFGFIYFLFIIILLFGLSLNISSSKFNNTNLFSSAQQSIKNKAIKNFTTISDLNNLPFGKNLVGIVKQDTALPENGKLYCADIDKYGDIALGIENRFVVFSYNPTYNPSINGSFPIGDNGKDGCYNEHIIVNNINQVKNPKIYTSVSGSDSIIGDIFIPSSVSFDNNADLLFSYTVNSVYEEEKTTGLVYIPYTPQFDGLTNPILYPQTKNINYGIDIINGKTTGTSNPNYINDYKLFDNYTNNIKGFYWSTNENAIWRGIHVPIMENIERISSAQLSYDGKYIIFSSSRAGSRSNLERRSLLDGSDSQPASKGLPLTFMMKKQVDNDYDINENKYVVGKGKQADSSDPSKKNVKLNNSGFFISKIFPIYYQNEWDSHDFAFIHNYTAINKDNYVALSGDVVWDGAGNANPIRISTKPISKIYDYKYHPSNSIVNKQFQIGTYNTFLLNESSSKITKSGISHSNYITTNANSDTFYSISSSPEQGFKINVNADIYSDYESFGVNYLTNNGNGNKYDPTNSNYNNLCLGTSLGNPPIYLSQRFNDLTVAGNNSIGVSFSESDNSSNVNDLVNNNSNFAFTWGTHSAINISSNIYNISKQMIFKQKNLPLTPNSSGGSIANGGKMGGNLLIKFNKFSSNSDTDSDVLLSKSINLNGAGYVFLHHDINDPKPPKLNTYSINIQKAIPVEPYFPIDPAKKIANKTSKTLTIILIPIFLVFFISFLIFLTIIYFKKRKNKQKKLSLNNDESISNL